jgi:2-polyprenyl-3-methyl-5-hydroxy-6-metoxy-1,4-benzoquinol methylase
MARPRKPSAGDAREARLAWERAFDVWEDFQESGLDYARDRVHGPALIRAIGPARGLRVLDVGCGQGRFTRVLARTGARVSAVDWSTKMIRAARAHERRDPLGIDYHQQDAVDLARIWKPNSFDLVVACMSFMDMPDLPRVLRAVPRVLRSDGRLVFSVSHPMNTASVGWSAPQGRSRGARVLERYFELRRGVTAWRMRRLKRSFDTPYWHRTLEGWFTALAEAGFTVDAMTEPRATAGQVRKNPLLLGARTFPFFLVVSCRLRPSPGARGRRSSRRLNLQARVP